MTYQTDEKHLTNSTEYFAGAVKVTCYCLNNPVAAVMAAAQQYCCTGCCYRCPSAGRNTVVPLLQSVLEQWQQLWQNRCGSLQRGNSSSSRQHRHWRLHINIVFPPFLDPTSLLQRGVEV
jgi:hypothetical protein